MLRSGVSSNVNIIIRDFATAAGNLESEQLVENRTLINDMSKADEELSRAVVLNPNETNYRSLIQSLCKQDRFDDANRVLIEMHFVNLQEFLRGFVRIGVLKAFQMRCYTYPHDSRPYEVAYTSLMNAYLDQGKLDDAKRLLFDVRHFTSMPSSVLYSVIINGLDNKARTTQVNKYLLRSNYQICLDRPILEYHSTMVENSSHDHDGIVYNLFIFAHCKHSYVDEAYIMYKEMVHNGFACHMFTVFALVRTLERGNMVNELLWVIQNVLRSCNLNDSEIVKFLNEVNPNEPESEALFDVLAEKVKDGLFLKCSYAPASA
ncbi:hypothetical protein TSUD_73400 [Trifolium subterraneum]|uniref:Pentacotripeptide-repeat region of PRORP domain-containing protein n=1 Tax=Trifolium subterraneum TaxID=3900 RepID=A0A2Z6LKE7_TRISU|nr:hypothetical protein TSUD_73400 [Trifolium subterraneum]